MEEAIELNADQTQEPITQDVVPEETTTEEESVETPQTEKSARELSLETELKGAYQRISQLATYPGIKEPPKESQKPYGESEPSDLAEIRHLEQLEARVTESVKKAIDEKSKKEIPNRLRNRFSDLDQVLTETNFSKLKAEHPEIFSSLDRCNTNSSEEIEEKTVTAYKIMNALGYSKKPSKNLTNDESKEKIIANSRKPISSNAVTSRGAVHKARTFTSRGPSPEEKKRLAEETRRYAGML